MEDHSCPDVDENAGDKRNRSRFRDETIRKLFYDLHTRNSCVEMKDINIPNPAGKTIDFLNLFHKKQLRRHSIFFNFSGGQTPILRSTFHDGKMRRHFSRVKGIALVVVQRRIAGRRRRNLRPERSDPLTGENFSCGKVRELRALSVFPF